MKRILISLLMLVVGTSVAFAQPFIVVNSPVAIDRLVNGTTNEDTYAVAPTPPGASPTAGLNK